MCLHGAELSDFPDLYITREDVFSVEMYLHSYFDSALGRGD